MSPQPTPLGQYQLIEKIAQGGMAEIYRGKAMDAHGIEKPVVIKRILPHIAASPEFVNMLVDEAKIAVMLSHGNIAQVYDLGKVADDYFIVMEYVEGKTLSQIMKRLQIRGERIPIPYALYLCAEVANGLGYMHDKADENGTRLNIVHRDISPQNIILSSSGTVKIIDFGIAKAKTKISTTDSGVVKGKFAYMSPEHAEGEKLDSRTDIFSLGIILFELLTGQRLFKGKNNRETIRNVRKARIPSPSELRDAIDKRLDDIVLKALDRNREERYHSAFTFSQDLTRLLFDYDPNFAPQELIQFLQRLFPEGSEEKEPKKAGRSAQSVKTLKEKPLEFEDTKIANPRTMKSLLSTVELYSPPPPPPETILPVPQTPPEEKALILSPEPVSPSPGKKIHVPVKTMVWFLVLACLAATGYYSQETLKKSGYFLQASWKKLGKALQEISTPSTSPAIIHQPESQPPLPTPAPIMGHPIMGKLRIESIPPGASIFLDDQELKKTTPAEVEAATGQEHKVGLHLDRYRFWEGKVQFNPGDKGLKIPLELNYGELAIASLPSGAEVYLNGVRVGVTPFSLEKVKPDTAYEIVLKRTGYQGWQREVKVFGGKKEVVNASLVKIDNPLSK